MELTPELRAFLRYGFHRLYCIPYEVITEGDKKGRLKFRDDLDIPVGGKDCVCLDLPIKYNGVPI